MPQREERWLHLLHAALPLSRLHLLCVLRSVYWPLRVHQAESLSGHALIPARDAPTDAIDFSRQVLGRVIRRHQRGKRVHHLHDVIRDGS